MRTQYTIEDAILKDLERIVEIKGFNNNGKKNIS